MIPANRLKPRDWILRWFLGLLIGTTLIGITSPVFVRTYASRQWDPVRSRNVYPEGLEYRWRSEGYATSTVGPHGMMGRTDLPPGSMTKIALWGDSQAEGVCMTDEQKLWSALEQQLSDTAVLPFAESGDNAVDWLEQFSGVEEAFDNESHLILLHELSDLQSLATATLHDRKPPGLPHWIDRVPDFTLEAGRRLFLTESNEVRRLRFVIGPVVRVPEAETNDGEASIESNAIVWSRCCDRLRRATDRPITIAYAPHVSSADQDPETFNVKRLESALAEQEIRFVDCREILRQAIRSGVQPFGFQNGQIGSGHINSDGYQLIAEAVSQSAGTRHLEPTKGN